MCASQWVSIKPRGAMKAMAGMTPAELGSLRPRAGGAPTTRPVRFIGGAEFEHTRWYPKDGELCLGKTKPEETLVEVCSDSDVQIDRQIWV